MKKILFLALSIWAFSLNAQITISSNGTITATPSTNYVSTAVTDSLLRVKNNGDLLGAPLNSWALPNMVLPTSTAATLTTKIVNGLLPNGNLTDSVICYDAVTKAYTRVARADVAGAATIGDYSGVVQFSAGVSTNLTTVVSTNAATSGTLLSTVNRVTLTSASVSGSMVVNPTLGTITIAKAGSYSINIVMNIQSAGANGQWGQLVKNNTTIISTSQAYSQLAAASMQIVFNYTGLFAVGDVIDVRLSANSAGTIGITGYSYSVVQESGFLPVIGNSIIYASSTASSTIPVGAVDVAWNAVSGSGVINTGTLFTLKAGKTYRLEAMVGLNFNIGTSAIATYQWVTSANTSIGANTAVIYNIVNTASGASVSPLTAVTYTPLVDTDVKVRILTSGAVAGSSINSANLNIIQVGTDAVSSFANLVPNDVNGNTVQVDITKKVGIGTTAPTSNLTVNGSFSLPFTSTGTTNLTVTAAMYTINCNNATTPITVTLPTPVSSVGRVYTIKRDFSSTGIVTIATAAGSIMNPQTGVFAATQVLPLFSATYKSIIVQSDGTNWHVIN